MGRSACEHTSCLGTLGRTDKYRHHEYPSSTGIYQVPRICQALFRVLLPKPRAYQGSDLQATVSFPPHHVHASHPALCMLGAHNKSSKQLCKGFSGLVPSILELLDKTWGCCPSWKLVASRKRCRFMWQAGPNTHLFQLRKLEALVVGSLLASTGLETSMLARLALGQQKVLGT